MAKLGVFGGSFDPVHYGHLFLARLAMEAAGLDRVLFVPAGRPPHKDAGSLSRAEDRLLLLQAALRDEPDAEAVDAEIRDGGTVFTVDTLTALAGERPADRLVFVLGMDSLADLPGWRRPEEILARWPVVAVDRPGFDESTLDPAVAGRCLLVRGNPFGISSTLVRARAARGLTVRHLVPPAVAELIRVRNLYAAV